MTVEVQRLEVKLPMKLEKVNQELVLGEDLMEAYSKVVHMATLVEAVVVDTMEVVAAVILLVIH